MVIKHAGFRGEQQFDPHRDLFRGIIALSHNPAHFVPPNGTCKFVDYHSSINQ